MLCGIAAVSGDLDAGQSRWAVCEFWSLDEVGQVIRRRNSWHTDRLHPPTGLPTQAEQGEGLPGAAWQTAEPVWITDLEGHRLTTGQARWLPLRGALAVPIPSGTALLGVLVCYSDHHEIPDDLRTAVITGIAAHLGEFLERRRAEQITAELERTRDEYIALVGHELRTPLTSIQSYTDLLRTDPHLDTADRQQMLEVIPRHAGQLHRLVAGLLDVAGTRAGHTHLHLQPVDLAALAHAAAASARTGTMLIDVNSPPEAIVTADPTRIRQAVDELLSNALTWTPENSSIGVTVHADQHTAVIAVSNTGPRIPADQHQRVFDLFYRSDTLRHGGVPGTGLGLTLALARAIIEQHDGALTISEPDEATTTFTIRLPRNGPVDD